jgi:hypothetical protein
MRGAGAAALRGVVVDVDLVVDEGHPGPELVLELEHDVGDRTADT